MYLFPGIGWVSIHGHRVRTRKDGGVFGPRPGSGIARTFGIRDIACQEGPAIVIRDSPYQGFLIPHIEISGTGNGHLHGTDPGFEHIVMGRGLPGVPDYRGSIIRSGCPERVLLQIMILLF